MAAAAQVAPSCERCGAPAVHGEHFRSRIRVWCAEHTPWSGHFEYCGERCEVLVQGLRVQQWEQVKDAILRAIPGDDTATASRRIELFLEIRSILSGAD